MKKRYKVAVIYHYWAHYREPVASLLCKQKEPFPEYVLFSDKSGIHGIRTIDTYKSNLPISEGGLNWRFIHNIWFTKKILWQSGLIKLSLDHEFDTIIYLGQMNFLSTWVSAFIARLFGKRVLMWTHGFLKEEANIKGLIRSCFYKLADGILTYGNRARRILIGKGFNPKNMIFVLGKERINDYGLDELKDYKGIILGKDS